MYIYLCQNDVMNVFIAMGRKFRLYHQKKKYSTSSSDKAPLSLCVSLPLEVYVSSLASSLQVLHKRLALADVKPDGKCKHYIT